MWYHLSPRTKRLPVLLTEPRLATGLWKILRRSFPVVAAVVIMPNHFHVVVWAESAEDARCRMIWALNGLARASRLGVEMPEWESISSFRESSNPKELARLVRYIALNPCRAGLVEDPLSWLMSSYRDVLGAVVCPWITGTALAGILGRSTRGFDAAHHAYVSGDPDVAVGGTPLPQPFQRHTRWDVPSLEQVRAAVAVATRTPPQEILRRTMARQLFVQLAWEVGHRNPGLLARTCGITTETVRVRRIPSDPAVLKPLLLCLGDQRLLQGATIFDPSWGALPAARVGRAP